MTLQQTPLPFAPSAELVKLMDLLADARREIGEVTGIALLSVEDGIPVTRHIPLDEFYAPTTTSPSAAS